MLSKNEYEYADIHHVKDYPHWIPVGSVEFIRAYAKAHSIFLPLDMTYPESLKPFLKREIRSGVYADALMTEFVKPKEVKVFTGAIKQEITEDVDPLTKVWISPSIHFAGEVRVYILQGNIVGYAQYDDGELEVNPDLNFIYEMTRTFKLAPCGYSLDIGLVNNEWVLIEVNDGWALGFYQHGTLTKRAYLDLITQRWKEIERG